MGLSRELKSLVMRWAGGVRMSWQLLLNRTRYNYSADVNPRSNSAVVACMNWAMRTFPEAPLQVARYDAQGERSLLLGHSMTALVERPNPFYSGPLLWMATLADYVADGNAYWRLLRNDKTGAPVQMWWIPQSLMQPAWPQDGSAFISHYVYTVNGTPEDVAVDDIIHFRYGLDPDNPRRGLSPLHSLLREIFTDDEAGNFSATLLKNLGVPGVVIAPKGGTDFVTELDAQGVKEKYMMSFGGDKRGEPLVMTGPTDISVMGFNPQQMDLKSLRRLPEERVSAVMGIPAIVAGLGAGLDRSTFANYKEAREAAYESFIIPTQRLLSAEVNAQLLPQFGGKAGDKAEFDNSHVRILQEDEDARNTRVRANFTAGLVTLNQARAVIGEQPDPAGDYYLRSANVVAQPFGELPVEPEPEPVPAALLPAQQEPPPADEEEEPPQKARQVKASGARLIRRFAADARRLEPAFAKDMEGAFEELADKIKVHVGKKSSAKADAEIISDTLTGGELVEVEIPRDVTKAFQKVYEANFERILVTTAGTIAQHLSLPVGVNLEDPVARRMIQEWATRKGLADVGAQTREAIMQALADGRADGDGAAALARRIRGMVEGRHMYPGVYKEAYEAALARGWKEEAAQRAGDMAARQYRATTIARSETKYSQNMSSLSVYKASEVVDAVIVYDGTDDDDECRAANGQTWSFEKAAANPLQHPRCVRSWAPKVRKTVE